MPSGKVTPSEEVKKINNILNYMEDPLHSIRRKDSDNFQGHSTVSTGWFNIDHELLKRKFSTLEPDFYTKKFEKDIEGQNIKTYKTSVVPMDDIKLYLSMRNDLVTKKIASDDEKEPKDSESSRDKKKSKGEICGPNFWKKST